MGWGKEEDDDNDNTNGVCEEDNINSSLNRGMDMEKAMQLVDSIKQNILL